MTLRAALAPRSIAVIGASDNPHKVGGRPILYMKRYGFRGAIYPINPGREEVQGLKAFKAIGETPEAPDLAVIAVAGEEAVRAGAVGQQLQEDDGAEDAEEPVVAEAVVRHGAPPVSVAHG